MIGCYSGLTRAPGLPGPPGWGLRLRPQLPGCLDALPKDARVPRLILLPA